LPGDDLMFNEDKLSLDLPIRDATNQREQLMHWIADQFDLPNLYRRDVYLFVNGVRRGTLYHDTQQPDAGFLEEWFSANFMTCTAVAPTSAAWEQVHLHTCVTSMEVPAFLPPLATGRESQLPPDTHDKDFTKVDVI
jgi:hypothetical protein